MGLSSRSPARPQDSRGARAPGVRRYLALPIRVCFAGQNPLCLAMFRRLLPRRDFQLVTEDDLPSGVSGSSAAVPLVVALDEKSPTLQPKFLHGFRTLVPGAKMLVLGETTPPEEAYESLRGVEGFVLYSNAAKDLVPALRQLANGYLWLPRSVWSTSPSKLPRLLIRTALRPLLRARHRCWPCSPSASPIVKLLNGWTSQIGPSSSTSDIFSTSWASTIGAPRRSSPTWHSNSNRVSGPREAGSTLPGPRSFRSCPPSLPQEKPAADRPAVDGRVGDNALSGTRGPTSHGP